MSLPPILLVEDDTNDVFFFQRAVEKAAVPNKVQVARDGREAVDYLSGRGQYSNRETYPLPGLIILDLNMPRKNGFEVLQWLRQTPPLDMLPTVILTSSQEKRDIQQATDLGARAYHVKPSDPDKLVDLVGLMMKEIGAENQAANTPPTV